MNQIQTEKNIHSRLPVDVGSTVGQLRSKFISLVPFDRKGKLGLLRNKVSAHYEKDFSPMQMRELLKQTDSTEIGEWLHICISVLCDLLKLDAYMWNAPGSEENTAVIMCQEPLVSVIRVENSRITGLENVFIRTQSPRAMVFEKVREVAEISQGLFARNCKYQIRSFTQDRPGELWAKTIHNTA